MTNLWLENKRKNLIGCHHFYPRDYGHLLWFWGYINDTERDFIKKYGKLRGLVLASQEKIPIWTHSYGGHSRKRRPICEEEAAKIERRWKNFISKHSQLKIIVLDWLTQDPIDYNVSRDLIIQRYERYKEKLGSVC